MLHLILFSAFGLVCVAGAVNLLVQRHPINSALSLVIVMGSLAVIGPTRMDYQHTMNAVSYLARLFDQVLNESE